MADENSFEAATTIQALVRDLFTNQSEMNEFVKEYRRNVAVVPSTSSINVTSSLSSTLDANYLYQSHFGAQLVVGIFTLFDIIIMLLGVAATIGWIVKMNNTYRHKKGHYTLLYDHGRHISDHQIVTNFNDHIQLNTFRSIERENQHQAYHQVTPKGSFRID